MSLLNIWHLRQVAEASAKPCDICFKPTTGVLVTPDNQDHFYVCHSHLKDRGFCSPIIDEAEAADKERKEDIDRQLQLLQKQYETRLRRNKSNGKGDKEKEKDKGKDKEKDDETKGGTDEEKAEKEKTDKIKAITQHAATPTVEKIPRIYALQKVFYQKRLDRKRNAEIAKRDRERLTTLRNPTLFPSVPKNNP